MDGIGIKYDIYWVFVVKYKVLEILLGNFFYGLDLDFIKLLF